MNRRTRSWRFITDAAPRRGFSPKAKQNVALSVVPGRRLRFNQLFTLAALLCHNLARELQMRTSTPTREDGPKRAALWEFASTGTLRQRLIHRAGRFVRPQGKLVLRMNANEDVECEMRHYLNELQKLPDFRARRQALRVSRRQVPRKLQHRDRHAAVNGRHVVSTLRQLDM